MSTIRASSSRELKSDWETLWEPLTATEVGNAAAAPAKALRIVVSRIATVQLVGESTVVEGWSRDA